MASSYKEIFKGTAIFGGTQIIQGAGRVNKIKISLHTYRCQGNGYKLPLHIFPDFYTKLCWTWIKRLLCKEYINSYLWR